MLNPCDNVMDDWQETKPVHHESLIVKLSAAFGGQIGIFIVSTATQIVIARGLGPAGKGLFSLTLLTAVTLSTLAHGSLSSANSHYAGRYPNDRSALVGNSFFLAITWGAVVIAISYAIEHWFRGGIIPALNSQLWLMVLASLIPLLMFEFANGLVMGLDWMKRFSLVLWLKEALLLIGVFVLWRLKVLTTGNAAFIWLLSCIISSLLQAGSAWWRVNKKLTVSFNLIKRVASFSAQSHIANVFSFLKQRVDMFLIAYYLTLDQVGYYSVAMAMIATLWYLPAAISQVLIPHISWRDNQAGNQLTPRLCRFGFAVSILGAVLLGLLGWLLIRGLFGTAFLPALPALLLLLPGGVLYTLAKMLAGDLIGRGLPKYAMVISIAAFVVNIIINIVLIPRYGIVGAAIASTIAHGFTGIMFLVAFLRVSSTPIREVLLLRRDDLQVLFRTVRPK
jgi:O-antigen/teichoic acid export membrane protein